MLCWSLADGARLWQGSERHEDTIWQLAWSPDGSRIASASDDRAVRVWDAPAATCFFVATRDGGSARGVAWSPDGSRLAIVGLGERLQIVDGTTGAAVARFTVNQLRAVAWSPDGRRLAAGFRDIRVIDANSGAELVTGETETGYLRGLAWSHDGRRLASAENGGLVRVWDAETGAELLRCAGHNGDAKSVAWSPDGRCLASGGTDGTARVWDAATGAELACFTGGPGGNVWSVAWAPSGAFLVSGHQGKGVFVWDTRPFLTPQTTTPPPEQSPPTPIPPDLRPLPEALAQLHRLDIHPPLSLLHDLRHLLSGAAIPEPLAGLAAQPGLQRLRALRWPAAASTGLIALLLRGLPATGWTPPADLPPERIAAALTDALAGPPMPPEAPPPPAGFLATTAGRVDDRVLTLLAALGPHAVQADPALPLRLLPEIARLPRLDDRARRLLGLRLTAQDDGAAQGEGAHGPRAGISPRGRITSVLASQYALPPALFDYRAANGGLLYRARSGRAPPRLHPVVLVLDVSPAAFGPVEAMTRPAAHAVASTLRAAGLPVALVTAGGAGTTRLADCAAAALAVLTERSLRPADAMRAMAQAETLRRTLVGHGAEPLVLLLAHPWFGAEEPEAMVPANLRGLFIQYPRPLGAPGLGGTLRPMGNPAARGLRPPAGGARAADRVSAPAALWQAAEFWRQEPDGRLLCTLCPFGCRFLAEGVGRCRVRRRSGDRLETSTMAVRLQHRQPIERKPFYHVHPGAMTLTLAAPGCTMRCDYCQNAGYAHAGPDDPLLPPVADISLAEIAAAALHEPLVLALSFTEPTLAAEATLALHHQTAGRVPIVWKTNGFITREAIARLAPALTAVNIDLKAADPDTHLRLTGAPLPPIVAAMRGFAAAGVWVEIASTIIPGVNDSDAALSAMAILVAGLGAQTPWHLRRFHPDHLRQASVPTPAATLRRGVDIARAAGLHHVYVERALGAAGRLTQCPACGDTLIVRGVAALEQNRIADGSCVGCGSVIAGRWSAHPAEAGDQINGWSSCPASDGAVRSGLP